MLITPRKSILYFFFILSIIQRALGPIAGWGTHHSWVGEKQWEVKCLAQGHNITAVARFRTHHPPIVSPVPCRVSNSPSSDRESGTLATEPWCLLAVGWKMLPQKYNLANFATIWTNWTKVIRRILYTKFQTYRWSGSSEGDCLTKNGKYCPQNTILLILPQFEQIRLRSSPGSGLSNFKPIRQAVSENFDQKW